MLGNTIQLYRAEIRLNGETTNIYFEDHSAFKKYAEMMCQKYHDTENFEICSYGWYDMKIIGC